jgi:predicted nuclease of restriction endonuclease-like RecB superfamily
MLSPEHVRVRQRGGELQLLSLTGELRERAVALAAEVSEIARSHVGKAREELESAWETIESAPRERKIVLGLCKLVEDASDFESGDAEHAEEIRLALFGLAAERRRGEAATFDRAAVLAEVARARGSTSEAIEAALYADLRGAQRLVACRPPEPELLVERYVRSQVQAVLLRAVRVVAEVECNGGDAYRTLFQKLKFRRLMHQVSPLPTGGYRIEIDGPFSLFQSVAKYGMELALILPALEACQRLRLSADVRWSNRGKPLKFRYETAQTGDDPATTGVRDEVRELVAAVGGLGAEWSATLADRVLDLPGAGVCTPDVLLRRRDGIEVLVEVLGFWSRESVWQRVELAKRGLGARILFVVSSRLRVSEAVLDESEEAALYVFKGRINAKTLLRHADVLAGR